MSKCSVGVNITLKSGRQISHKYYSADQLKDFVITCDISEEMKSEIKKKRGPQIDNWVMKNQEKIFPQMFAAQRDTGNKKQPPRMMSHSKYYEDV